MGGSAKTKYRNEPNGGHKGYAACMSTGSIHPSRHSADAPDKHTRCLCNPFTIFTDALTFGNGSAAGLWLPSPVFFSCLGASYLNPNPDPNPAPNPNPKIEVGALAPLAKLTRIHPLTPLRVGDTDYGGNRRQIPSSAGNSASAGPKSAGVGPKSAASGQHRR